MKPVITAIIIGVAAIVSFAIIAHAYKYRSTTMETIVVTGLAEKDFNSDLIVWNGSYSRKSMDLKTAYAELKTDENSIRNYLLKKGVSVNEMVFSAVVITKSFAPRLDGNGRNIGQEFDGYNLTQTVSVESSNIDKVDHISREATELIQSGIEFNSSAPLFYNTKLKQVKMELLGQASADAKTRAETIAKNAGSSLGKLKKATMGVFQITGKNSNEDYSYGGAFNTSNRFKTGSITIKMEFEAN
ncbi:SIMPL domain-containing protein [Mucilaginibacter boryungensis]|uniref:SIMPL domain-containing protein n=1 Tax=Mucilaginibacter boryungensis TaxID=768480 RepID=A0ABR9XD72_9SPHI|nr:SIMPL domain-containing protein [Mucilaginibacter boryungensis]MBE9665120.1 SIMPL domain-containing protein [Mucilaginibacter boryungensis]